MMGEGNRVVGLLALRVDPRGRFQQDPATRTAGQIGRDLRVRPVRATDQRASLRRTAAADRAHRGGRSPHAGVELRDPGVDLTSGGRAAAPREALPYTRMARGALAGQGGTDLSRTATTVACVSSAPGRGTSASVLEIATEVAEASLEPAPKLSASDPDRHRSRARAHPRSDRSLCGTERRWLRPPPSWPPH